MKEVAYNLFLFIDGDTVREVGIVSHRLGGRDDVKLANLRATARADFAAAKRFPVGPLHLPAGAVKPVPVGVNYDAYWAASQTGAVNPLGIFEAALQSVSARRDPLFCITAVVNGVPRIDGVVRL